MYLQLKEGKVNKSTFADRAPILTNATTSWYRLHREHKAMNATKQRKCNRHEQSENIQVEIHELSATEHLYINMVDHLKIKSGLLELGRLLRTQSQLSQ